VPKRDRSYARPRQELVDELRAQVGHLSRSAEAYDDGHEDEAARLAVSMRVLLHDGAGPGSLLRQLGLLADLRFVDTSLSQRALRPDHPGRDAGLASMEVAFGRGGRYVPLLADVAADRKRPPVPFGMWWTKTIYRSAGLSRRDLVLALADTDGGAHVDPRLAANYAGLTRQNTLGWSYQDSNGRSIEFEGNAAKASIRQMTWEVLETLAAQVSPDGELVAPSISAGRNDPCPCGSGEKFKRCCGM
jgi:hypothetical protein